jgi:hypothetical protein
MSDLSELGYLLISNGYFAWPRIEKNNQFGLICSTAPQNQVGHSFWITHLKQDWYLCYWSYRYWKIPKGESVAEICQHELENGTSIASPTQHSIDIYHLVEVDDEEFSKLLDSQLENTENC